MRQNDRIIASQLNLACTKLHKSSIKVNTEIKLKAELNLPGICMTSLFK
jgi:hypothetical protein